ncbi:MAG TPA: hypothetical protein VMF06_20115 [Candidatus Limnocylindria bacterium]|nr:hypothetical protein [Candidatus Limnocylindria bacterium]
MTEAQRKRFFFPNWTKAFDGQWIRDRGFILPRPGRHSPPELVQVEALADQIAREEHRVPIDKDFRHAAQTLAIGKRKDTIKLTTAEQDRCVFLFRLLANPDDIEARINFDHRFAVDRQRLETSIVNTMLGEAYLQTICLGRWKTHDWRGLPDDQMLQFAFTACQRARARAVRIKNSEQPY